MNQPLSADGGLVRRLRKSLTADATALLGAVWTNHLQKGSPIPRRLLQACWKDPKHSDLILKELNGSLIVLEERSGTAPSGYAPTLLGALVGKQGVDLEPAFERFIGVVREHLHWNPSLTELRSETFAEGTYMAPLKVAVLGCLLRLNSSGWSWGGSFRADGWIVNIPDDIERFFDAPIDALHSIAAEGYDPHLPIARREHRTYLPDRGVAAAKDDLFAFVTHNKLRDLIASDWAEAQLAREANASKATLVMCGCVFEGVLLGALRSETELKNCRADLDALIKEAKAKGLLTDSDASLSDVVKDYRNLVHPDRQLRKDAAVTPEKAAVAFHGLQILIAELSRKSRAPTS